MDDQNVGHVTFMPQNRFFQNNRERWAAERAVVSGQSLQPEFSGDLTLGEQLSRGFAAEDPTLHSVRIALLVFCDLMIHGYRNEQFC